MKIILFIAAVVCVQGCTKSIQLNHAEQAKSDENRIAALHPDADVPLNQSKGLRQKKVSGFHSNEKPKADKPVMFDFMSITEIPASYLFEGTDYCEAGNTMRIWWSSISVCRTPEDSGSHEEWKSRLEVGFGKHDETAFSTTMKRALSPPDNLSLNYNDPSSCWQHGVNKTRTFKNIPKHFDYVFQRHYGIEDDVAGDDELPGYIDIDVMQNCAGNYKWVTDCGWNDDYRRYSCTSVQYYVY